MIGPVAHGVTLVAMNGPDVVHHRTAARAGLSAALVLSRARRRVVVVDDGTPRNAPATHMHGYLSQDGSTSSSSSPSGRRGGRYGWRSLTMP